ncbi:hypothetical protein [uncultured Tateyamaria sp.]|uniref:hypothetical protein n=1 Tax=uncultured Tateyamaria sp. TaxID=455651 RepID=UPI0026301C77|nr:hypothetical protein [uncultured Tateyamaria sp.]
MKIDEISVPDGTLIAPYAQKDGHYVDCFETPVTTPVTLPVYIRAFYTQPLFRAERVVLRLVAGQPSTDADVQALADGGSSDLAVWQVEARRDAEILMVDRSGRTLSWLMVTPSALRFGSVVVPVRTKSGKLTLGPVFQSLLSAHKIYARALLSGAARRA